MGPLTSLPPGHARARQGGGTFIDRGLSDCPPRMSTSTHDFQEKEIVLLPHSGQVLTPQLLKLAEINSVVATPAAAFSWVGAMGVLSSHCNPRQVREAPPGCGVTLPPGKAPTVPLIGPLVAELCWHSDGKGGALLQPPPGLLDDYEGRHIAVCCSSSLFHTYDTFPGSGRVPTTECIYGLISRGSVMSTAPSLSVCR